MKILIIEDDSFKLSKIENLIKSIQAGLQVIHFDNVFDTIQYINTNQPDKIILDMSLPSHATIAGLGNPLPMPNGGIEIILELKSLGITNIPIIILTQYESVEVEHEHYSINESAEAIKSLYDMLNVTVVHYDNDSDNWVDVTRKFMEN